jgi:RNA polymerase sigma-32 factor
MNAFPGSSGGCLDPSNYLPALKKFPMLERQDEMTLARRWRTQGDPACAYKLVTSHLRFVMSIALRYRSYGLPVSDLVSEGNVGLMQALARFDPDKGYRLSTYASWWIKAEIQSYVIRSWSLVKIGTTAQQRKLFFNLRHAKRRISALESGDLRPEHTRRIAAMFGTSEQDVTDMNRRLGGDTSLNAPLSEDSDGEWLDRLADNSMDQEATLIRSEEAQRRGLLLHEALGRLNDRERRIFVGRRLADEALTLEQLATEFRVSRERIRQIEMRALDKITRAVLGTSQKGTNRVDGTGAG